MNRKSEELKEKQISEVMASIENRVRHAYNQGYEQGLKDSKQEPCEDAISRQYLIDEATKDGAYDYVSAQEIANAPSVTPKPKIGHWIQEPNGWVRCSRCSGHYPQTSYGPIIGTNYCPDCGADMRGEE